MQGKYDTLLDELAEWFIEHRKEMAVSDMEPIVAKHIGTDNLERELEQFVHFLQTPRGRESWGIAIKSHLATTELNIGKRILK